MTSNARHSEQGAALITVLMIVAAMSVAALAVAQSVTTATQRARSLDAQAQLTLYAAAAEEVAKARLADVMAPLEGRLFSGMPGLNEPQIIPVDNGNFIVTGRDANNCFDVNSLIKSGDGGASIADDDAQAAYQAVLEATLEDGYSSDLQALVSSLTDWMDSNSVPGSGGAEDAYYQGEVPSYRTSGQRLATLDELRAIRGYEPDIIDLLRPVLCARPEQVDINKTALNINTLEPQHAPLLRQAFSGALALEDAENLIANRPQGGWPDLEALLEEPVVKELDPALIQQGRLGLVTSLLEVSANVSYRDHEMTMRYLFEALPGRPIRTLRRERIG